MIEGSCHCGKIKLKLNAEPKEAIECNCSHCRRKGYLLAFFPRDALTVEGAAEEIGTYTFNKHAIRHHFCRTCGCAPFAEGEGKEGPTAAANLRCFDVDLNMVAIRRVDGKSF
ncbi:MAG TPA: GFA family protein [Allosphingosinicella sp.]|nr:GFA family protein [Allosphingosinicella sp.]